jgi:putative hydrolase of the HAD superfamily
MNNKIKAIIFDYGGVLCKKQSIDDINKMADILKISSDSLIKSYLKFRHELDRGVIDDIVYWNKIMLDNKLNPDDKIAKQLSEIDIKSWSNIDFVMIDYIKNIKEKTKVKTAVLSNMIYSCLKYLNKNYDLFKMFDVLTFSCDLKLIKPEKEIYLRCAKDLGLKPEECLFIDDLEVNINGAKDLGFNVIHYNKLEQVKEFIGV